MTRFSGSRLATLAVALGSASSAFSAGDDVGAGLGASSPTQLMALLLLLGILPFFLLMVTSFVKITIVVSILRNALGVPQIPPNQIVTALAILLSAFVMAPVGRGVVTEVSNAVEREPDLLAIENVVSGKHAEEWARVLDPLQSFLASHAGREELDLFARLSTRLDPDRPVAEDDLLVLMPAFVVTELKEAFVAGFLIFLPFLIIDMVVANILMALGMFMLTPTTISLPIKLLVFVLLNGWVVLLEQLVLGYLPAP